MKFVRDSLPVVLGGDFNLIRNNQERSHGQGDQRLMDIFNEFIGNQERMSFDQVDMEISSGEH